MFSVCIYTYTETIHREWPDLIYWFHKIYCRHHIGFHRLQKRAPL